MAGLADGSVVATYLDASYRNVLSAVIDEDQNLVASDIATGSPGLSWGGEGVLFALDDGGAGFVELSGPSSARKAVLRVLDADGALASATTLFEEESSAGNYLAAVLPKGRAVVASRFERDGEMLLQVRLFAPDGRMLSDKTLNPDPADNNPTQIVATPGGGFMVLMTAGDWTDPEKQQAIAVKFTAKGARDGKPFLLHRNETGDQSDPHGAWLEGGDFIAVWSDASSSWTNQISGQGFDPSGDTAGAAPTDLVLKGAPVALGTSGALIGRLSAVDADAGDSFEFSLVNASDSNTFRLEGDKLYFQSWVTPTEANASFYGQVAIRVEDSQFNLYDETLTIDFATAEPEPEPVRRIGTRRDDVLKGRAGDDVLKGKGGDDMLIGRDGRDRLIGGDGQDTLKGGAGADRLEGGMHRDLLIGGGGRDVFILDGRGGPDTIRDYRDGADRIRIEHPRADDFDDLVLRQRGEDVLIRMGKVKFAFLEDVDKSELDASDFLF